MLACTRVPSPPNGGNLVYKSCRWGAEEYWRAGVRSRRGRPQSREGRPGRGLRRTHPGVDVVVRVVRRLQVLVQEAHGLAARAAELHALPGGRRIQLQVVVNARRFRAQARVAEGRERGRPSRPCCAVASTTSTHGARILTNTLSPVAPMNVWVSRPAHRRRATVSSTGLVRRHAASPTCGVEQRDHSSKRPPPLVLRQVRNVRGAHDDDCRRVRDAVTRHRAAERGASGRPLAPYSQRPSAMDLLIATADAGASP